MGNTNLNAKDEDGTKSRNSAFTVKNKTNWTISIIRAEIIMHTECFERAVYIFHNELGSEDEAGLSRLD